MTSERRAQLVHTRIWLMAGVTSYTTGNPLWGAEIIDSTGNALVERRDLFKCEFTSQAEALRWADRAKAAYLALLDVLAEEAS